MLLKEKLVAVWLPIGKLFTLHWKPSGAWPVAVTVKATLPGHCTLGFSGVRLKIAGKATTEIVPLLVSPEGFHARPAGSDGRVMELSKPSKPL